MLEMREVSSPQTIQSNAIRGAYQKLVGGEYGHFFVLQSRGSEAGYTLLDYGASRSDMTLYELVVLPGWRSIGIGSQALRLVEGVGREQGVDRILLRAKPLGIPRTGPEFALAQRRLIDCYRRAGYKIEDEPDVMVLDLGAGHGAE